VKSGTDFRELSLIEISYTNQECSIDKIEKIIIDSTIEEKPEIKAIVDSYLEKIEAQMDVGLGQISVDLEGRFGYVRKQETNLGNFVCDIMLSTINADCAFLNSGTFRSDMVHMSGEFKVRDLKKILPLFDELNLVSVTGKFILTLACTFLMFDLIIFTIRCHFASSAGERSFAISKTRRSFSSSSRHSIFVRSEQTCRPANRSASHHGSRGVP
jgi:hypothetical protein